MAEQKNIESLTDVPENSTRSIAYAVTGRIQADDIAALARSFPNFAERVFDREQRYGQALRGIMRILEDAFERAFQCGTATTMDRDLLFKALDLAAAALDDREDRVNCIRMDMGDNIDR